MRNGRVIIVGARGGKSFQAGFEAGYAQCKQEIASETPSTEEMKWLRKLRLAILGGEIEIRFEHVNLANEANLKTYAEKRAADYAEEQTARYIKSLQDQIDYLRERQASDI